MLAHSLLMNLLNSTKWFFCQKNSFYERMNFYYDWNLRCLILYIFILKYMLVIKIGHWGWFLSEISLVLFVNCRWIWVFFVIFILFKIFIFIFYSQGLSITHMTNQSYQLIFTQCPLNLYGYRPNYDWYNVKSAKFFTKNTIYFKKFYLFHKNYYIFIWIYVIAFLFKIYIYIYFYTNNFIHCKSFCII